MESPFESEGHLTSNDAVGYSHDMPQSRDGNIYMPCAGDSATYYIFPEDDSFADRTVVIVSRRFIKVFIDKSVKIFCRRATVHNC